MSQLPAIKKRIKTISNIRQVTKAMETVTQTRVGKVRQNANQAKYYQALFADIFAQICAAAEHGKIIPSGAPETHYFVFLAHKGFCGGFNDKLLTKLQEVLSAEAEQSSFFYMLGRHNTKLAHYITQERLRINVSKKHQEEAKSTLAELVAKICRGQNIEIYFAYNELVSILEHKSTVKKIYPPPNGTSLARRQEIILEPNYETIYPNILRSYLAASLDKVYWESLAGEHYARLLSMHDANRNAQLILTNLNLQYNKTRQTSINQELSEVVSAFDVLKEY